MTMHQARVLVADDHALFRDGLVALINRWPDFTIASTASNGEEAVRLARRLKPDLILMDVRMEPMGGVQATRAIRQEDSEVKIVMLTMSNLGEDMFEALRAGAHGYISKDEQASRLHDYLNDVLAGGNALSSSVAAQVLADFSIGGQSFVPRSGQRQNQSLTASERKILRLVVDGLSNEEIAHELHVSEATVKKHLSRVMTKLHMRNRVQVAVFSVRQGIVD